MLVGVGQSRAARRFANAQMHQPSQTASQTVADFAQRIGTSELAKQHGDKLGPAGEALGSALSLVPRDDGGEFGAREMLEQLIEEAGYLYDCLALLGAAFGEAPAKE